MARGIRSLAASLLAATIVLAGCSGPEAAPPAPERAAPDAGIQLFQLPWNSIADECENTLGPNGIAWVLTSPPQEHIISDEWWVSYQPVSYQLESRLGTRQEFADMVTRCGSAGVDIIADAVINHMTGQDAPGTGWVGSAYEHYEYPGLYTDTDFHHCGLIGNDDIADYDSAAQVQSCELVNLADLDTASPSVRETIDAYLDDLLSLGVAGFRIDAAKHMASDDVAAIASALPQGTRIMSEVIRGPLEPIQPDDYVPFGEVFEFSYARDLAPQLTSGMLSDPDLSTERPMHVPSESAIVFIDNHDTERGGADITYRDGPLYMVANALMFADNYGTPALYSGYAFSDRDAGPPTEADGTVSPGVCVPEPSPQASYTDGDRTCIQDWTGIAGMLEWRSVVGDAPRLPGVNEGDAYGFEREARGVIAVNPSDVDATIAVPTTMPDGQYCDVVMMGPAMLGGSAGSNDCPESGRVSVRDGAALFALAPVQAKAIHLGSRLP